MIYEYLLRVCGVVFALCGFLFSLMGIKAVMEEHDYSILVFAFILFLGSLACCFKLNYC